MKTTTMSSKCFSGARGLSHVGMKRAPRRAHARKRRHAGPARRNGQPRLTIGGQHAGYVGAPLRDSVLPPLAVTAQQLVLHVDADAAAAAVLSRLLAPDAQVIHVPTLAAAVRMLETHVFSLVVLDPALPDGDARALLPLLSGTPLLVYSAYQPDYRAAPFDFLSKPWTSSRQLWSAISTMLGKPGQLTAGD